MCGRKFILGAANHAAVSEPGGFIPTRDTLGGSGIEAPLISSLRVSGHSSMGKVASAETIQRPYIRDFTCDDSNKCTMRGSEFRKRH
jgi:hypothetical protein